MGCTTERQGPMVSVESQTRGRRVPVVLSGGVEDRFEDRTLSIVELQEYVLKKHRTNYNFEQVRENLWGSYSWFQVVPPLHLSSILR